MMDCEESGSSSFGYEDFNKDLIQIKTVDEDEIFRRIESFIRNKRNEVNERNIREFISPSDTDNSNSCARVDAVYIQREGMKSHINLKSVENAYGPQTRLRPRVNEMHTWEMPASAQRAEALEERIANMEAHLNMSDILGPSTMHQRIKALEERINFLEGISPEYFTNGIPENKKHNLKHSEQEYKPLESYEGKDLSDIDHRIKQLKELLKLKAGN